jgi:hypothetical protein
VARQGQSCSLVVRTTLVSGGPPADVTGLTITIVRIVDNVTVVAATAVGIQHPATGVYTYVWAVPVNMLLGDYLVVWQSATGNPTQHVETITVGSALDAPYADFEVLRNSLKIKPSQAPEMERLALALVASSRAIDSHVDKPDGAFIADAVPSAQRVRIRGNVNHDPVDGDVLLVPDLAADPILVEVGSGGTWTPLAGWTSDPVRRGRPITALRARWPQSGEARITGQWGYPALPHKVTQAALIQATRWFNRPQSPEGLAAAGEWGALRLSRVDPDVAALLEEFTLPGIA